MSGSRFSHELKVQTIFVKMFAKLNNWNDPVSSCQQTSTHFVVLCSGKADFLYLKGFLSPNCSTGSCFCLRVSICQSPQFCRVSLQIRELFQA